MRRRNPKSPPPAHNPFRPGNWARRLPEFRDSGGWMWGDTLFQINHSELGYLVFKDKRVIGDFYYGFFEKVLPQ